MPPAWSQGETIELPRSLLVVEDQVVLARSLARALRDVIPQVFVAHTLASAEQLLVSEGVQAVLVDEELDDGARGSDLLRTVAARWPGVRRVLMSGQGDLRSVVAHAILRKPFPVERALVALNATYPPGGGRATPP